MTADRAAENSSFAERRRKLRAIVDNNYIYAAYSLAVPGMASSLLSVLYFNAGVWAIISALLGRFTFRLPRGALPLCLAGVALYLVTLVSGLRAEDPLQAPLAMLSMLALPVMPLLIGRMRVAGGVEGLSAAIAWAPLGAALGMAAALVDRLVRGGSGLVSVTNATMFGVATACLAAFCAAGMLSGGLRARLFALFGFLASSVAVFLSDTRALYPAVALVGIVAIVSLLRWLWPRCRNLALVLALAIAGVGTLAAIRIVEEYGRIIARLSDHGIDRAVGSETVRLELWQGALSAFAQKPLLGHGPQHKMEAVYEQSLRILPGFSHAHNALLDIMVAAGAIGGLLFAAVMLSPLLLVYPVRSSSDDERRRRMLVWFLLAVFFPVAMTAAVFQHDLTAAFYCWSLTVVAAADPRRDDLVLVRHKPGRLAAFGRLARLKPQPPALRWSRRA